MAFSRETALEFFRRAHSAKRLAHAYLISGAPGSGKRSLAAEVTSIVNGTKAADVFSAKAREVFVAEPESKSRRIVIEQVRELEHALQMQAAEGRRKVAIISDADRLQPQAANAFLKTLEEPPANSLLLLLTALPEVLPDTIRSRCIPVPITAESGQATEPNPELIDLLRGVAVEKHWSVQHAYRLAGHLQRLLGAMREEIKADNAEALQREETRYKNSTDGSWLDEREDYYKALSESLYLQRRARLIETLFAWWTDVLRAKSGLAGRDIDSLKSESGQIAERFTSAEILRRIRRLEQMRDHLGRNIQEALALEVAFLGIFGT